MGSWLTGPVQSLSRPAAIAGDTGAPDGAVRYALASAHAGTDAYLGAVEALCGARLLFPVVDSGRVGAGHPEPDRRAELAAVLTTSASGSTGVLGFTGLDSLKAFDPAARPVPCTLDELAATALETGSVAVVIDLHGPVPLAVEEPLLSELAAGHRLVKTSTGWGWLFVEAAIRANP